MKCNNCKKEFGYLAHKYYLNKQICNECCKTAKHDSKGLFKGCKCVIETIESINAQSYFIGSRRSGKTLNALLTEIRKEQVK